MGSEDRQDYYFSRAIFTSRSTTFPAIRQDREDYYFPEAQFCMVGQALSRRAKRAEKKF